MPNEKLALKIIENEAPDLFLLDITMPDINGQVFLGDLVKEKLKEAFTHCDCKEIIIHGSGSRC